MMSKAMDLSRLLPLRFRWRGEVAAAVYGELSEDETRSLEAFLERAPHARVEFESMKAAHGAMPDVPPQLGIDLAPILRTRLAEESMRGTADPGARRRLAFFATASLAATALFCAMIWQSSQPMQDARPEANRTVVAQSPMDAMLREAEEFIADRNYDRAYRTLEKAVAQFPGDSKAGGAQLKLADIAFENLQWYDKARTDYKHFMDTYWKSVTGTSEQGRIKQNWEMLEEASGVDYASLRDLEKANRAGGESFAKMQGVAANYPGTIVASKAAEKMADAVVRELPSGSGKVVAMEAARGRCTNAVAAAQLDFELGCIYRDNTADTSRARRQFEKVRDSGQPILAKRAEDALATLGN